MKFKKGQTPWNKGKKGYTLSSRSQESKDKMKIIMLGKNKGRKHTVEAIRKIIESQTGEKHWRWKGGITSINEKIRKSTEYKLWRKAVFERDNYTCVWCKDRQSKGHQVILHADHIKRFAYFPELRFAIDNGRTLCISCHRKTDTYGSRVITIFNE